MSQSDSSLGLSDTDPMPVAGVHLNKPMEKVPASYLDWLHGQPFLRRKYPEVYDYIERNRKAIDWELRRQGKID
jgi:hypothetical protein